MMAATLSIIPRSEVYIHPEPQEKGHLQAEENETNA